MNRIIIEKSEREGIPSLTIYPEGAASRPTVVYLHGFGSDKSSGLEYGYRLASAGFVFVAVDCWLHGGRAEAKGDSLRFSRVYPEDTGIDTYMVMHEVIRRTSEDFPRLVRHLRTDPRVDPERIGVTGFSMGAFATFLIAAEHPQVKAAVAIGGKPSFRKAWDDIIVGASTYDAWRDAMRSLAGESAARSEYLAGFDPFDKLQNFHPRAMLMINGDRDVDQPFIYALELYKKLVPLYESNPERLGLSMPPLEHRLAPEMIDEGCRWFERFL